MAVFGNDPSRIQEDLNSVLGLFISAELEVACCIQQMGSGDRRARLDALAHQLLALQPFLSLLCKTEPIVISYNPGRPHSIAFSSEISDQ